LQGGSFPIQVGVNRSKDFKDPVNLGLVGLPSGITAQFSRTALTASSPAVLTITAGNDATPGSFTISVVGTSGTVQASQSIAITVQKVDYLLFGLPAVQVVLAGKNASYDIFVGSPSSVSSSFSLSVSGLPPGVSAGFQPATVNKSGHANLTVNTANATPTGQYAFTVKATSGATIVQTTLKLSVRVPDFTVTSNYAAQATKAGKSVSQRITVSPTNGFKGKIDLKVSGLPPGSTAAFSPASVTDSGTATLNITTAATTPSGRSALTVTATSGTVSHFLLADLTVGNPDFDVSVPTQAQVIAPGEVAEYQVNLNPQNGFGSPVILSVSGLPPGVVGSFSSNNITLPGTVTLLLSRQAGHHDGRQRHDHVHV
jgi:uncharacterized membrane protein